MSVIARFRRSLGFSPGGQTAASSSETCSTSPTRPQERAERYDSDSDEEHDKEQRDIFANEAGPSSLSSPVRSSKSMLGDAQAGSAKKTSNSSPAGNSGPVLAYFVLESSAGDEKVRYPIRKRVTKIGRLPVNDIRIYRETVSRLHCEVHVGGDIYSPEDRVIELLVHNPRGVRINGAAVERNAADSSIKAPISIRLHEGDLLEIYRNYFRVRQPSFHSYSRNTSPIAQRQPLGALAASSSRIGNSPTRLTAPRDAKPSSSPIAPSCSSPGTPDLLKSEVPRILKGRRSLFTATPKREIQRNAPWTAEPVKSRAHRRVPSGSKAAEAIADALAEAKLDDSLEQERQVREVDNDAEEDEQDVFGGISVLSGRQKEATEEKPYNSQQTEDLGHDSESGLGLAQVVGHEDQAVGEESSYTDQDQIEESSSRQARPSMRRSQSLSPKKPRRRSTFFGRAGVFANWNFGFYPEERKSQEESEKDDGNAEESADAQEKPAPIVGEAISRSPKPFIMPQPRLDESGRPRLPRSISSPDMRPGSPKRRVVSLRTATLLRAGQQAFEQQKLHSPPASPVLREKRPVRYSFSVPPASTPDEEEDEAEVEQSLSLLEMDPEEDSEKASDDANVEDANHARDVIENDDFHDADEVATAESPTFAHDNADPPKSAAAEDSANHAEHATERETSVNAPILGTREAAEDDLQMVLDQESNALQDPATDTASVAVNEPLAARQDEDVGSSSSSILNIDQTIGAAAATHRGPFAQDDLVLQARDLAARSRRKPRQSMPVKLTARKSRRVSKLEPLPSEMLAPAQPAIHHVEIAEPEGEAGASEAVCISKSEVAVPSDANGAEPERPAAHHNDTQVKDMSAQDVSEHNVKEGEDAQKGAFLVNDGEKGAEPEDAEDELAQKPADEEKRSTSKPRARPAKKAAIAALMSSSPEKGDITSDVVEELPSSDIAAAERDRATSSPSKRSTRTRQVTAASRPTARKNAKKTAAAEEKSKIAEDAQPETAKVAEPSETQPPVRSTRSSRRKKGQEAQPQSDEACTSLGEDAVPEERTTRARRTPARKAAAKNGAASAVEEPAAVAETNTKAIAEAAVTPMRVTRSRAARSRA